MLLYEVSSPIEIKRPADENWTMKKIYILGKSLLKPKIVDILDQECT